MRAGSHCAVSVSPTACKRDWSSAGATVVVLMMVGGAVGAVVVGVGVVVSGAVSLEIRLAIHVADLHEVLSACP